MQIHWTYRQSFQDNNIIFSEFVIKRVVTGTLHRNAVWSMIYFKVQRLFSTYQQVLWWVSFIAKNLQLPNVLVVNAYFGNYYKHLLKYNCIVYNLCEISLVIYKTCKIIFLILIFDKQLSGTSSAVYQRLASFDINFRLSDRKVLVVRLESRLPLEKLRCSVRWLIRCITQLLTTKSL